MVEATARDLTPKGKRTRERILATAVELFGSQGYEKTTMREIAAGAGCSLGLAYHYFASKDDIVLELYSRLAADMIAQVAALEPGPLAERFDRAIRINLGLLAPFRQALTGLFGPALNPESDSGVLGDRSAAIRQLVGQVFAQVVAGAVDAPSEPQAGELGTMLYGLHLGLVFFWLQDRTPGQQSTEELLAFLAEALTLAGPLLALPDAATGLARLVRIIGPVLG
jgi:AcrR family transcriptional regulator